MTAGEASAPSPFMQEALDLARSVLGTTSPNPAVGAVIVREGRVVGRGATQPPGGPHAEVVALREAGGDAQGAICYVTLEPCSFHGRTPPCTEALISAGVAEVVVAAGDPDRRVSGEGLRALAEAGIRVRGGDGVTAAARHYEAYAHHRRTGRPFVTAKYAASLDGKIAATSGDSRWVSGPETLAWAHRQRPQLDAILVGVDTIVLDDPQLTARPGGSRERVPQPLRVVLDSRGRTPAGARVLTGLDRSPTLIATTPASDAAWRAALEQRGVRVAVFEPQEGRVPPADLLDYLGESGVVTLLVEGGGQVLGSFFDAQLIDKVHAAIAPMIIGGDAASAVAGRGAERMRDAVRLTRGEVERLGTDLLITGYPVRRLDESRLAVRPASEADLAGWLELPEDPAARDGVGRRLAGQIAGAGADGGACWVAVDRGGDGERVVGGVALICSDPEDASRADGRRRAAVEQLHVAAEWRPHGVGGRLIETAEGAAEGRGFSWLTVLPAPSPIEGVEGDASGLTAAEWRARGFRYYRRTPEGRVVRIKRLQPDPGMAARRRTAGGG
jgi:diaminohydroxyphosphoribosylaminopyrimidine deaminase/5-amino-6-(5-phosphoribosylamino)uracil reductase